MTLRIRGQRAGHLITSSDGEYSLRVNQQQARFIVDWLVNHCNADTIYFLWDEMKITNERYLLESNAARLLQRLEEEERGR